MITMDRETREEILRRVGDATAKTPRQLDAIACDYAMTLKELGELVEENQRLLAQAKGRPQLTEPVNAPKRSERPAAVGKKVCGQCKATKPLDDFREDSTCADGHRGICRDCTNRKPLDVRRTVNNRARHRATAALVEKHKAEFERLYALERELVLAEHAQIAAAAAEKGHPDAAVARLKPGKPRANQTSVLERLDVARCPQCHQFHDAGHQVADCQEANAS